MVSGERTGNIFDDSWQLLVQMSLLWRQRFPGQFEYTLTSVLRLLNRLLAPQPNAKGVVPSRDYNKVDSILEGMLALLRDESVISDVYRWFDCQHGFSLSVADIVGPLSQIV